jgi:3-keto-disaccharide hydrolase/FG-GAP-like repeat
MRFTRTMAFLRVSGLACIALFFAALHGGAQGPHSDTAKAFNGSSLAGWHPHGSAQWRVANGEILGSATTGPGVLVLDRAYQDFVLTFAFQCECDAGVLLRNAPAPTKPETTTAIYAGISGPDALTAQRVSLDATGTEVERTQLFKWVGRQNLPYMQLSVTPRADGWKQARIQLRGDAVPPRPAPNAPQPAAALETFPAYGAVSLRIGRGELRVKNVEITDLLRPPAGVAPEATAPDFRRVQLTDRFYAEGISVGDVNRDGKMDALSGPYAYLGPEFERAIEIYPPQTYSIAGPRQAGLYTDNFLSYVHDFTGDGWNDYLKINFDGAYLYVNPKGESRHWQMFQVTDGVSSETTQFGDIDGDGKPELLMSVASGPNRVIGLAKPGTDATKRWTFVPTSEKGDWGGHGYGYGDVNGDGKADIVQGSGWWEQPASGANGTPWPFHAGPFGRGADPFVRGSDIFVYDVNGDKLPDIITSLFAHGPGLAWFEQQRTGQGPITWKMHMVMDRPTASPEERKAWEIADKSVVFTELHAISLVDMDGDGIKDLVTGKRWWSHGIEYSENDRDDPAVVAWLKLTRKPGGQVEFVPHVINNYVGLGTQIATADMNADGKPDVLIAARKGAYLFLRRP